MDIYDSISKNDQDLRYICTFLKIVLQQIFHYSNYFGITETIHTSGKILELSSHEETNMRHTNMLTYPKKLKSFF